MLHSVLLLSQNAQKNVLLEEFSTAQCGFCPEGGIYAENLINKYPNLFTFTHHAGFGTDSMTIPASNTIAYYYTTFAPAGVIDRGYYPIPVYTYPNYIAISRQKWDSIISIRLNEPALAEVALTQNYDNDNRLLDVKIDAKFLTSQESKDYRINLAIVEDSVTGIGHGWDQKNYFNSDPTYPTLYKKGDTIIGYIHRHVLRALPTGTWGVSGIIPNSPESGKEYSYELKGFQMPAIWKVKDISLVAFVSYYDSVPLNHKILNSVQSTLSVQTDVRDYDKLPYTGNSLEIYPNPVSNLGYADYFLSKGGAISFELYSISGDRIREIKSGNFNGHGFVYFYVSDLPNGIYILRITGSREIVCKKFSVIN